MFLNKNNTTKTMQLIHLQFYTRFFEAIQKYLMISFNITKCAHKSIFAKFSFRKFIDIFAKISSLTVFKIEYFLRNFENLNLFFSQCSFGDLYYNLHYKFR